MESGRRVLESYRRWQMIDGATSDEDKVTPVYKLEEICVLLLSSHVSIVKEISGFIFKRLQHKSAIVKQKALRVIKHAVGKSGAEFRREMQKNSVAVRQLIHYKGHPDPLKGDALNKSLRETAQEALSAIFSGQDNNNAPLAEGLAQRIQGFGNTNFDMPPDGRKSFFREVVDIGSATVKHGLGSLTQAQTQTKNDTGTYTSQNLHGALTTEISYSGSNGRYSEALPSGLSTNVSGPWGQDLKTSQVDATNRSSSSFHSHDKTREERLLETIVTSGGVRLQPTREALQIFLIEALKLNALALSQALEAKLQSHMWQVLSLLNGQQSGSRRSQPEEDSKTEKMLFHMPDLIDTNEPNVNNDPNGDESIASVSTSTASLIDSFFTGGLGTDVYNNVPENNDDPFADVSFHGQNNKEELNDIFGSNSQVPQAEGNSKGDVNHLMAGLSINGNKSLPKQTRASHVELTGTIFSESTANPCHQLNDVLDNTHKCQSTAYNNVLSSGLMFDSIAFTSQPKNYGAMSSVLAQQQFLSAMANLRQIGNLQSQNVGASNISGTQPGLYDFFNSSIAAPTASTVTNKSKKEDTRAFDFISDHLAAARDPKRVN